MIILMQKKSEHTFRLLRRIQLCVERNIWLVEHFARALSAINVHFSGIVDTGHFADANAQESLATYFESVHQ